MSIREPIYSITFNHKTFSASMNVTKSHVKTTIHAYWDTYRVVDTILQGTGDNSSSIARVISNPNKTISFQEIEQ